MAGKKLPDEEMSGSARRSIGTTTTARMRGLSATIEGLLASMWFAWARVDAPSSATWSLEVGGVVGLVVASAGVVLAASRYGHTTVVRDAALRRRYNRVVAAELALVGAGASVLAAVGLSAWIPPWVCAGLGLHFLPAARAFDTPFLSLAGLAITLAAAAALVAGLTTTVAPSVIAGSGAGGCLLITAFGSLAGAMSARRSAANAGTRARRSAV